MQNKLLAFMTWFSRQKPVSKGIAAFFLIFILVSVYHYFSQTLLLYEKDLAAKQELWLWMRRYAPLVQKNHESLSLSSNSAAQSPLGKIQHSLKSKNLESVMDKLEQLDNKKIRITFKNIKFDELLQWLFLLRASNAPYFSIAAFSVQQTMDAGIVNAEVMLSF